MQAHIGCFGDYKDKSDMDSDLTELSVVVRADIYIITTQERRAVIGKRGTGRCASSRKRVPVYI